MRLILQIQNFKGEPYTGLSKTEFDEQGGGIGRKESNKLVLPCASVSSFHAWISFQNGQFFINDGQYDVTLGHCQLIKPSTNGTTVCLTNNTIKDLKGNACALTGNETISIGEFELFATISAEQIASGLMQGQAAMQDLGAGPFATTLTETSPLTWPPQSLSEPSLIQPHGTEEFISPVSGGHLLFEGGAQPASSNQQSSPLSSPFPPIPGFSGQQQELPESPLSFAVDIAPIATPFSNTESAAVINPPPANTDVASILNGLVNLAGVNKADHNFEPVLPQNSSSAVDFANIQADSANAFHPTAINNTGTDECFEQFLRGAGLTKPQTLSPAQQQAIMHTTGQLFRKLIDGLMDELQARKAMKEGFRLGMTRLKATDNNALKHLSDAEAFIQTILFTQNPTFSSAENAVSEGFRDLKFHRIAMAAGIQASLNAHLNQFDPEMIEKLVDSSNPLTKKSKCWDFYCARFPELKMATIQDFFGEEFADEYENQIRNLTL